MFSRIVFISEAIFKQNSPCMRIIYASCKISSKPLHNHRVHAPLQTKTKHCTNGIYSHLHIVTFLLLFEFRTCKVNVLLYLFASDATCDFTAHKNLYCDYMYSVWQQSRQNLQYISSPTMEQIPIRCCVAYCLRLCPHRRFLVIVFL